MPCLDLLGRGERLVRLPGVEQSLDHIGVDVAALRLPVGAVGSADLGPLIPVQPQPAQRIQQSQIAVLAVPLRIGVLDPEHERPAGVSRVCPVEQGGANQPDVRRTGR